MMGDKWTANLLFIIIKQAQDLIQLLLYRKVFEPKILVFNLPFYEMMTKYFQIFVKKTINLF